MRNKNIRNVLSVFLVVSLILGQFGTIGFAEDNTWSGEDVSKILTEEQRKDLTSMELSDSSKIKLTEKLDSAEKIDVIVELKDEPIIIQQLAAKDGGMARSFAQATKLVMDSHNKLDRDLVKIDIFNSLEITARYTKAFNGVAMSISKDKIEELATSDEVKAIWKDMEVKVDPPVKLEEEPESRMMQSSKFLGIEELHEEGITGQGLKVGVLDTGIDHNHPDFKESYKGGYDFVENDNDPMEATYSEWKELNAKDPEEYPEYIGESSYYTSHGTHVSGTIASQGHNEEYPVLGISPDVDLYVYRVLGPYGRGQGSFILSAIERAIDDGMDIINLSLGANENNPMDPLSTAIDNATLGGMICILASGNIGPDEYTVGTPATSALGIAVGASDVITEINTFNLNVDGEEVLTKIVGRHFEDSLASLTEGEHELVDVGEGEEEDYKDIDVEDKFVLIESGAQSFYEKMLYAKDLGVKGVIIWNNEEPELGAYYGENNSMRLTLTMKEEEGKRLKDKVSSMEEPIKVSFSEGESIKTGGDNLADFSSRGPTLGKYHIKPDIVAPGVFMLSTAPDFVGNFENPSYDYAYQRMSGTSMAAPYATGVAALIKQHNPEYTPVDMKSALMNSSVELKNTNGVFEVGAGRISPKDAVYSDVSIQVMDKTKTIEDQDYGEEEYEEIEVDHITGSISYGIKMSTKEEQSYDKKLKLKNRSNDSKTFDIEVVESGTGLDGVNVETQNEVTLPAGGSIDMEVLAKLKPDCGVGMHQGYINFTNQDDNTERYRVPFVVRVTLEGVEYATPLNRAFHIGPFHPFRGSPWVDLAVKLSKEIDTIDLYLRDGDTDKTLGFINDFDGSILEPDVEYLFVAFHGQYRPLTGDPDNPISDEVLEVDEGHFKIEFVAKDFDGNTFTIVEDIFVDRTNPEITLSHPEGVYELEYNEDDPEGEGINWFKGNLYDSTIPLMRSKGYDVDFTTAEIYYYENSGYVTGKLPVEPNGDFKFGVAPEEFEDGKHIDLKLFPIDFSTAGDFDNMIQYRFIAKGQEYLTIDTDKSAVGVGDRVTTEFGLKNTSSLSNLEFTLNNLYGFAEIEEIRLNDEFEALLEENDIGFKLDIEDGEFSGEKDLSLELDSNLEDIDLEGIDIISVDYKCRMGKNADTEIPVEVWDAIYTDAEGNVKEILSGVKKLGIKRAEIELNNVEPEENVELSAGEELKVSFYGPLNGKASFSAKLPMTRTNDSLYSTDMVETGTGYYEGSWIIPEDLEVDDLNIEIQFEAPNGDKISQAAPGRVSLVKEKVEIPEPEGPGVDPGKPVLPELPKPEKPEEPEGPEEPEKPEEPKDPETVELTEEEIEEVLEKNYKDRKDIPEWAERAVAILTEEKIVSGRDDKTFDSSANVSRAEFMKMIVESFKLESDDKKEVIFKDVKPTDWFKEYVDIGVNNNIARGIGKDEFGPNLKISREDLSVMVYNAVKEMDIEEPTLPSLKFRDQDEISNYAREAIDLLSKLEVITGRENNKFVPKAQATRAEAAVIIVRILDLVK